LRAFLKYYRRDDNGPAAATPRDEALSTNKNEGENACSLAAR
jgi:hypothetical protein